MNFGVQSLIDRGLNITTSFIKQPGGSQGGDWTNRIHVQPLSSKVGPRIGDPKTLNMDPDPEFWSNLDPGPGLVSFSLFNCKFIS